MQCRRGRRTRVGAGGYPWNNKRNKFVHFAYICEFLALFFARGFCLLTHSEENPCSSHNSHSSVKRDLDYLHNHEEAKIVNIYLLLPRLFVPSPPRKEVRISAESLCHLRSNFS